MQKGLLKIRIYLVVALVLVPCLASNAQEPKQKFSIGNHWGWGGNIETGFNAQFRTYFQNSRLGISANYRYTFIKGTDVNTSIIGGIPTTSEYNFRYHSNLGFASLDILLVKGKKSDYSGLSLGVGPGFITSVKNGGTYLSGPGIGLRAEYSGYIGSNFFWGYEWVFFFYSGKYGEPWSDNLADGFKLNDNLLTFKIGYLF